jgi:NTP pyrophosphatase (non-canonical NTP hydrolase)
MDLRAYQENAKRTMNWDLANHTQLSAMTLGVVGELGEVYECVKNNNGRDKILDESGDVFWYVGNLCTLLDIDWRTLFPLELNIKFIKDKISDAMYLASKLADTVKKTIAQRHILDIEKVVESLQGVIANLTCVLAYYDLTPQEVCAYNQEKLMKRYPNGFEASRSINRE